MATNGKTRTRKPLLPPTDLGEALRLSARDAYIRHKQAGVPLVVWRDGQIVHVPPDEIVVPPEGAARSGAKRKARSASGKSAGPRRRSGKRRKA
jgi:hypothetical protein